MSDWSCSGPRTSSVADVYSKNASASRINTDLVISNKIREKYPELHLTIVPEWGCNLTSYAATGHAQLSTHEDPDTPNGTSTQKWRRFAPSARRLDSAAGVLFDQVFFAQCLYRWEEHEFIFYLVDGRDGAGFFPSIRNQYVLSNDRHAVDDLISTVGRYESELHGQIWVFNQGYWQKDAALYQSILKSEWEDVILEKSMKHDLINIVQTFFNSRADYEKLKVPWKRGIIFYGPPGNGKTISIKATMHMLYERTEAIPTLYVKTLAAFAPPEYALTAVFAKARQEAPCYLVFEDLDSLVTDRVRSFFLNEVDGIQKNDGILMVGSTNHLERLDPGISKRPSRFDRKFKFPNPAFDQRVKYCQYWQQKLADNEDLEFPDELCPAIAKITDQFSFAYIQEAFVSALLVIANSQDARREKVFEMEACEDAWDELEELSVEASSDDNGDGLERYILWREVKQQVANLRKELDLERI